VSAAPIRWKPDWYWIGIMVLVQTLVIASALAFYDCAKKPHQMDRQEMRGGR
jgi:hypothetical protein